MNVLIRVIEKKDDHLIAAVIRKTLVEYKANKPGTVYYDESTDHLTEVFTRLGSRYFVAELDRVLVGGAGIYPTEALPKGTCELVKIYLSTQARGRGIGKQLIEKCIEAARELEYNHIYLETMPELVDAIPLYKKYGFNFIKNALGNSGHSGCDLFMIKSI